MNSTTSSFVSAFRTLAVVGLVAATHAVSVAATITLKTNAISEGLFGGGSYTASTSPSLDLSAYSANSRFGNDLTTFETFCLEYGEHFTPNFAYEFTIADAATLGNGGQQNNQDPISKATAWLYYKFGTGSLTGYDYSNNAQRKLDNRDLQLAFWFFESELGIGSNLLNQDVTTNKFVLLANSMFSDPTAAANGAFGVKVLNLTQGSTHKQSQLYLTTSVPDTGATASLLALALLGLAGVRRMFRR